MKQPKSIELLRELGLNQLEAEVYVFLLPQPPATAYKIAKSIGKPNANVYNAVEGLARKGAVIIEDGDNRTCRAVPVRAFLKRLEQTRRETAQAARKALEHVELSPIDERVYRIESADQVFSLSREMLTRAKEVAIIDAFPLPLQKLTPDIEKAIERGVDVYIETYEPISIDGARVAFLPLAEQLMAQWHAQQVNIVIDGTEHLMALLNRDASSVLQAHWSNSLYLSCVHHGGRLCEHTLVRAQQALQNGATPEEVAEIIENHTFFKDKSVPGHQLLNRRYNADRDTV